MSITKNAPAPEISDDPIDRDEYLDLKADERQQELLVAISKLTRAIKELDNTPMLQAAFQASASSVEAFAKKIQSLPAPQVSVSNNNELLAQAVSATGKEISAGLEEIRSLLLASQHSEWKFRVIQGSDGRIESVIATKTTKK